jgi:peptidoglycan/xylan/chitin deacetylase (PgdA/CDA1 family)
VVNAAKGLVKSALLRSHHYARRLRRESFPGVAVLCYHGIRDESHPSYGTTFERLHVRATEFDSHCRLLRDCCDPISLEQWRAALDGDRALPPRPVLVTFDDGYRTVFTLGRPILERYEIPAVVFVSSTPVVERRLFWHDAVARTRGEVEVEAIKGWPFRQWEQLQGAHAQPVSDSDPNAPLTVAEVRALVNAPGVEVGGHTKTHPILARATSEEQREQVLANKELLEQWTGRPVSAFAYPNGRPGEDFTAETVRIVREAGFQFGFTTRPGFANRGEASLEHPRFLMLAGVSAAELAHRLCYSWRRSPRSGY